MDADTEKILLAQARAGNENSFEALVSAHSFRLIGMAWRMVGNREDAEDLVQETFIRLHKNLEKFRGESSLSTWLYRVLSRLAIDHLRRQKLKQRIFFMRTHNTDDEYDPLEQAADPKANPGEIYLAGEAGKKLTSAMEKLSAQQRVVFILRHHEGLPLKEIAAALTLEEGTVKTHLHRAVHFLRNELKDLKGGLS
jgi:RNA polymerase sigma-70 factor (ECF subfamily)